MKADRRQPADVPSESMQAAVEAFQGRDQLRYPAICYRRLSHAVAAALTAERESFTRLIMGENIERKTSIEKVRT